MVYIIGIGPGDPELLTVKAMKVLQKADYIFYVSGLYMDKMFSYCRPDVTLVQIKKFGLSKQLDFIKSHMDAVIVRLHTGDLAFESGCRDFIDLLASENISYECIPGVSSFSAALSKLASDTLMPGISNSFSIVKPFGFPFVKEGQSVSTLAGKGRGVAIFGINCSSVEGVVEELYQAGCIPDESVCLASHISLPDEKVLILPLKSVVSTVFNNKLFWRFTILFSGDFLKARTVYSAFSGRTFPEDVVLRG